MGRIVFFLTSIFLVSNITLASNSICSEQTCIAVIDVGSTGSRLHVYAYASEEDKQTPTEVWSKKITPGFGTLNPTQLHINAYLDELFQDAPEDFPAYFYASAGMRLLPSEHQAQYYNMVKDWFEHSKWTLKEARTITGREEGIFAWLSVSEQLRRTLGAVIPDNLSVMDMGGASVQLITAVDSTQNNNTNDYVDINFHGKKQTLFVHSFLGLGQTLVSDQFLDEPTCFPEGYLLPDGSLGKGDAMACVNHVSKLIDGVHGVKNVLHLALNQEKVKTWYVIEGLAYLAKEAPFNQNKNEITNDELFQQAESTVCHRPWEDIRRDYPEEERLSRACLKASYYHALIKSYGIGSYEPIHLVPNTSSVDWTLGVVLHQG
jgi:hypothetical protein